MQVIDAHYNNKVASRQQPPGEPAPKAPPPRRFINPEDVRRLAEQGLSCADISRRLGFAHSTVSNAAEKHGITLSPHHRPFGKASPFWEERDAELRRLVEAGEPFSKIGRALGTTKNAACGRAHRLGLSWASTPPPQIALPGPGPGQCRWIGGDPGDGYDCFERAQPGSSFCPRHHSVVYRPAERDAVMRPSSVRFGDGRRKAPQ